MTKKLKEKYFSKLLKDKQLSDGRFLSFLLRSLLCNAIRMRSAISFSKDAFLGS